MRTRIKTKVKATLTNDPHYLEALEIRSEDISIYQAINLLRKYKTVSQAKMAINLNKQLTNTKTT